MSQRTTCGSGRLRASRPGRSTGTGHAGFGYPRRVAASGGDSVPLEWPDEAPAGPTPHGGLHGSASWFLGYHALNTLDYDLAGEFEPWAPPQPFDENTYGFPNRRFTKRELLGYVDWCRGRVRQTLDGLTEEMADRPLPSAHRYHGMLFAVIVGSMPLHLVEHASQIRQFLTAAGVTVQPMPGDRGYTG